MEEEISGYKEYSKIFLMQDIKKVVFMVVFSAAISNILHLFKIDSTLTLLSGYLCVALSMLLLYKNYFKAIKVFVYTACSILIFMLIEFSYLPLLISATGKSITDISNNSWLTFLCALPERIVEYSILAYALMKKASFSQLRLARVIFNRRFITGAFFATIITNIIFLLVMGKLIGFDGILNELSFAVQSVVVIMVLVFPIVNIAIFILTIYHIFNKEEHDRYVIQENIESFIYDMKIFAENGNYTKVNELINEMEADILNLYDISNNNKGVA
ncbi:hypothetical protein [Clostridium thermosuccinogenes]|nr:hypothetical protein [Pseudoclostridium thermosuccinogenes]